MKPEYVRTIVRLALAEDIGEGDITTGSLVPLNSRSRARLVAKAPGTICGLLLAREVFKTLDPKAVFRAYAQDGQKVRPGQILAEISGSSRALLSGERVALNFLTFLSGTATQTRRFADQIKPYKARILDTRKTVPLLRRLQRYAVRCGGGDNHRFNLHDMAMLKDNHRIVCRERPITHMAGILKKTGAKVEIEVDTLSQLREALQTRADVILLDNMTPRQAAQAVRLCRKQKTGVLLEVSGGISIKNVRQYAAAGVDRISIGALTHSAPALDISMEFLQT